MKFDEKLKALRVSKNMTQNDSAEKLYISKQSISNWEQGLTEPNIETLKSICLIFDVSLSELLDDDKIIVTTKEERQIKVEYKLFLANGGFVLFVLLLTAILIRMMPKEIPMHWGWDGEITRYGSKWETLFFVFVFFFFFVMSSFIHFYYKKGEIKLTYGMVTTQIILLISQLASIIGYMVLAFLNLENLSDLIPTITGITLALFIVLSIFSHPFINKNRNVLFGFRTKLTLSNSIAWNKINSIQSISGLIFSSISFIVVLITFKQWSVYFLFSLLISMIPAIFYHNKFKKTLKK